MHWNKILTEDQALAFVETFEPWAHGQIHTDDPPVVDIASIKIDQSCWSDFKKHITTRPFSYYFPQSEEESCPDDNPVCIEYCLTTNLLIEYLRDKVIESEKQELDTLVKASAFSLWFKFIVSEKGNLFPVNACYT